MSKQILISLLGLFLFGVSVHAENAKPLYDGFLPVKESKAYQRLIQSSITDHSKLVYLINRYETSKIKIRYNGYFFDAPFAAYVARWFLARHYKGQTPKEWVAQYCDRSLIGHDPIWVKLPSGKLQRSREILMAEIDALEDVLAERDSATLETSP